MFDIVHPSGRDLARPVMPFAYGVDAYRDGFPAGYNIYDAGTLPHARFAAGWRAAASVADAELSDVAAEVLADASGAADA